MIITGLLWIIYTALYGILGITILNLSDVSINSSFSQAIITAQTYVGTVDNFLPVTTIFSIIGLIATIEIFISLYKLTMWVIGFFTKI